MNYKHSLACILISCFFLVCLNSIAVAEYPYSFTAHTQSVGSVELALRPVEVVTATERKLPMRYRLTNSSDKPIECRLAFSSVNTVKVCTLSDTVTIPANGHVDGSILFIAGEGTYNGHYPIRVTAQFEENGVERTIVSTRVIETRLPHPGRFVPVIPPVPEQPKSTAQAEQESQYEFNLNDGYQATIYPGKMGLLDAKIVIGKPGDKASELVCTGVNICIGEYNLISGWTYTKQPKLTRDKVNNRLEFSAEVINNGRPEPVLAYVYEKNGILIIELPDCNPQWTGHFSLKRFENASLKRLYFGHGYALDYPPRCYLNHGGHGLAASHVGFDFTNGTSLVIGSPSCPERLIVDQNLGMYTIECTGASRIEIIPSGKGAYNAAVAFRNNDPFHASPTPGAIRKRGRILYDLFGGTYEENQKAMEKVAAYGVDDALVCKHIWQHWGYDIHLPDVWNPNADNPAFAPLGTYQQLRSLSEKCHELGFAFGLHDNYIDVYPDSSFFSYDYIAFHPDGTPWRAWNNPDYESLSYRSRPDQVYLANERNMKQYQQYLPAMDSVFIDVFCSETPYRYFDKDGNFHSKAEAVQSWKDCYARSEKMLSHTTPDGKVESGIAFSEAGADYLIGSISGADCQLLWHSVQTPCKIWNYTPWFASVNHTNFSRHGVGFPPRFNNRRHWSIYNQLSDEYITCEILAGVDMMISWENVFPGSVRNYCLFQHLIRRLADKEIVNVEFIDDKVQCQTVTWSDGTKVTVNRSRKNIDVNGYKIPCLGYIAFDKDGTLLSGIYCNPDNTSEVIETSIRDKNTFYIGGRGYAQDGFLSIQPVLKSASAVNDGKQIQVQVDWKADRPAPKDLAMFIHIFQPFRGWKLSDTRQGWHAGKEIPTVPTSQWKSEDDSTYVYHGESQTYDIPANLPDGEYQILVGMCNIKDGGQFPEDPKFINHTFSMQHDFIRDPRRYPLIGNDDQENRFAIGSFRIHHGRAVGNVTSLGLGEEKWRFDRLAPNLTPTKYQGVETSGCVVVTKTDIGLELLPIPMLETFDITLDENVFGKIVSVTCNNKDVTVTRKDNFVTFTVTAKDALKYRVKCERKNLCIGEAHGVRKRSGLKNFYTVKVLFARVASAFT